MACGTRLGAVGTTSKAPAATRDSNAIVGSGRCRNLPINSSGQRQDVVWQHGISVDGDPRNIKCKYRKNCIQ